MRRLALPALALALACGAPRPPPVIARAPAAGRPSLVAVHGTTARPSMEGGAPTVGDVSRLSACAFSPSAFRFDARGLLLQFEAPVPTDLVVGVSTPTGPQSALSPDREDEERSLRQRGRPYWYENTSLTQKAPTGSVSPREILLWPGATAALDGRFDVLLSTVSFDTLATGRDRQSLPLVVHFLKACPDFALEPNDDEVTVEAGGTRKVQVAVRPLGDGVGEMKSVVQAVSQLDGLKVSVLDAEERSVNWSDRRAAVLVLEAGPAAEGQKGTVAIRALVGPLERRSALTVRVKRAPRY